MTDPTPVPRRVGRTTGLSDSDLESIGDRLCADRNDSPLLLRPE